MRSSDGKKGAKAKRFLKDQPRCTLPGGMYELTEDVENLAVDRRKTGWENAVTLKSGLRLRLLARGGMCAMLNKVGYYGDITEREWLFHALLPNLKPVTPTTAESLEIHHVTGGKLLKRVVVYLIDSGKVSLDDVVTAEEASLRKVSHEI